MHRTWALLLATALACGCSPPRASPRAPAAAPPAGERSVNEVIDRALPAVVLLLNFKPDGSTTYGSGLLVGDGLALTNLHVVSGARSLGAMIYAPGRVSYTPMDGGLGRYIFENNRDVRTTTLVKGDALADLALVRIEGDLPPAPRLPFATERVSPGDRVLALGHPQETVWSFTAGAVSALHSGAIQHDAVVSAGSSGGPLLNARGEVIGINTFRVVSEARGLSFARPIEMADGLVAKASGPRRDLDLTTPEKAVASCWRAQELGSPSAADCVDWDAEWSLYQAALDDLRLRRSPAVAELARRLGGAESKARWIDGARRERVDRLQQGLDRSEATRRALVDARALAQRSLAGGARRMLPDRESVLAELARVDADRRRAAREQNGIKVDLEDPARLREVLRMGVRVEDTHAIGPSRVWVRVAGRNPDGTPFRCSELWSKAGDRWVQRIAPLPSEMAHLPSGWPPPMDDFQYARARTTAGLLDGIASELEANQSSKG